MTVTYSDQVATAKGLTLIKLFFRWKGSVIRLLWKDLLVYLAAYFMLHFIYAYVFNDALQLYFENIVNYAKKYEDIKTLSFVLGFFVQIVMTSKCCLLSKKFLNWQLFIFQIKDGGINFCAFHGLILYQFTFQAQFMDTMK